MKKKNKADKKIQLHCFSLRRYAVTPLPVTPLRVLLTTNVYFYFYPAVNNH